MAGGQRGCSLKAVKRALIDLIIIMQCYIEADATKLRKKKEKDAVPMTTQAKRLCDVNAAVTITVQNL